MLRFGGQAGQLGQGGSWLGGRPGALPSGGTLASAVPAMPRRAPPCPASDGLLISSFSPFMVFPVAVAFINKHFGDLPLRTSAPQESRALNIYK